MIPSMPLRTCHCCAEKRELKAARRATVRYGQVGAMGSFVYMCEFCDGPSYQLSRREDGELFDPKLQLP